MAEKSIIEGEKTVNVRLLEPEFEIGQKVYIPQRRGVVETTVRSYEAVIQKDNDGTLVAAVTVYSIDRYVFFRGMRPLALEVKGYHIYADKAEAEKDSRFLDVKADEETWKLAIGDREEIDQESPYHIDNCNLGSCCGNISRIRDILLYCKEVKGLTVHECSEIKHLLKSHSEMTIGKSLAIIFKQLEID